MKYVTKYIAFLSAACLCYGCETDKKGIQKQLDEKFGTYTEKVTPGNQEYYQLYDKALELWDIPFGEVSIETSFGNAHIIVSGPKNGGPVILLHGLNASSTMWYPNIKALSKNHRVYAIDDLLEPGKSSHNGKVKSMDDIRSWYNQIFTQLKLEEFSLIGASKGGWLAVNIALQQKARIKSMILLSPAQTFTRIRPGFDMLTNIGYTLNPKRKNLRDALETMSSNVDNIEQAYIDQYYIATENASLSKFILQMTTYSSDELSELTMPVLTLIGDNDIINVKKSVEKAKNLLPYAETGVIKNAGHFLTFDQPKVVNKSMLDFLNRYNITDE